MTYFDRRVALLAVLGSARVRGLVIKVAMSERISF